MRRITIGGIAVLAVTSGALISTSAHSAELSTTGTAGTPLDARHSPFLGGNRSPHIAAGRPGRIDIVATGPYDGTSLPIVVRNNTSRTVSRVKVTGVAITAGGQLLATGSDQGLRPNLVKPGEISIGYVYFNDVQLPATARFKLEANWDPSLVRFENRRDLVILRTSNLSDRIVGTSRNSYPVVVAGPIQGFVACFSQSGKLLSTHQDFTDQDRVGPHGSLPFQISLSGECPVYLVTVSGFRE